MRSMLNVPKITIKIFLIQLLNFSTMFQVTILRNTSDFFVKPLPSRDIYNYLISGPGEDKVFTVEEMKNLDLIRGIKLECQGQCLIQAILHD